MAEKTQSIQKQPTEKQARQQELAESLIRVKGFDIPDSKNVYTALTYIKGISWTISNAICKKLNLEKTKRLRELSKQDIEKIEKFLEEMPIADFLKNRRNDEKTGETKHLIGTNLDMAKEFDIKAMRRIRSYKGIRHGLKLPVRGQRTRSHFRTKGRKAVGVKRKSK